MIAIENECLNVESVFFGIPCSCFEWWFAAWELSVHTMDEQVHTVLSIFAYLCTIYVDIVVLLTRAMKNSDVSISQNDDDIQKVVLLNQQNMQNDPSQWSGSK